LDLTFGIPPRIFPDSNPEILLSALDELAEASECGGTGLNGGSNTIATNLTLAKSDLKRLDKPPPRE